MGVLKIATYLIYTKKKKDRDEDVEGAPPQANKQRDIQKNQQ